VSGPRNESCPVNEQAVAWALHALEPDEEMVVLRHLPTCPSCRAVAADAEEAFARMGSAVEQVEPPPSLRDSLMARVAETPQVNRPAAASQPQPRVPAPTSEPGSHRRDRSAAAGTRPPRGSGWSRRGRRLVAASVALVGVLAIGGLAIRTTQLQQQRDAEVAQAQSMSQLLGQLGRPGTQYALLAQDGGPTVAAVVVADGQRQVYALGIPANAADRDTYVLWGLPENGDPRALGTFDVAGTAPTGQQVGPPADSDAFSKYAISIEPGRVAPPTPSTVVAVGGVTA
jgi:anti-sigma-K factor RskA